MPFSWSRSLAFIILMESLPKSISIISGLVKCPPCIVICLPQSLHFSIWTHYPPAPQTQHALMKICPFTLKPLSSPGFFSVNDFPVSQTARLRISKLCLDLLFSISVSSQWSTLPLEYVVFSFYFHCLHFSSDISLFLSDSFTYSFN